MSEFDWGMHYLGNNSDGPQPSNNVVPPDDINNNEDAEIIDDVPGLVQSNMKLAHCPGFFFLVYHLYWQFL